MGVDMVRSDSSNIDPSSARLLQSWVRWTILAGLLPLAFMLILRAVWPAEAVVRFLVFTYLATAYQVIFLRRNLHLNQREGDLAVLPVFGPGNLASMLRGLMMAQLAGFLLSARPAGWQIWLPALLYTAGDVIDYFDGYLARRANHVTLLGERLDMEWDAFGLLVATGLAVWYGTLPWFYLPIGLARYAFSFGMWYRQRKGRPVFELPLSRSRRPVAGLTMGFMSAMLWPIVPYPATAIAGAIFLIPFALSFLRDWLVVSGIIDASSSQYASLRQGLSSLVLDWFPLLLRPILSFTLWPGVWLKWTMFQSVVVQFRASGFPYPELIVGLFALIESLAIIAIPFGFAARFVAFLLVFPLGFTIIAIGFDYQSTVLLIADLLLLIVGSGKLSLWKPSETLFAKRAGEG